MFDSKFIDHTILKPYATHNDISILCNEAYENNFKSVCVNPYWVSLAKKLLYGTDVLVCTVIGFPLGASSSDVKAFETTKAINDGADEIDMVINIGEAKAHNYEAVTNDIKKVVEAANGVLVKVILETCYLTEEEIVNCSLCAKEAGADFVKTSTGFGSGGATIEAVKLMRKTVGNDMGVKASGGIKTIKDYEAFVAAGASRIGTSNGIAIKEGMKNE
ncbi:MAG: deoxyribose-phosphate aldolase [Anaeroplasmataceae bacterium]